MTLEVPSMRARFAAQSVIEELLRQQSRAPLRSPLARLFGRTPLGIDSISWYLGARGELVVGALLAKLPPGWTVFHALPVGSRGSDIDHLVVGPGGTFTINTKNHSGKNIWVGQRTLIVSGQNKPYLRDAEFEAERVTKLLRERLPLRASVRAVIALVGPKQITIRAKPANVKVIDARHLRRWLIGLPPVLAAADVVRLAAIIDSPATWQAAPALASTDLMARFNLLDASVRSAGTRRVLWVLLGMAATIGVGIAVLPQLLAALIALLAGPGR